MLDALFSFNGRIGRLRYFLSIFAVTLVIIGGTVAMLASLKLSNRAPSLASLGPMLLLMVLAAPAYLWISLSLQARRFRDIGWSPLFVIPGFIVFLLLDRMLAGAVPALSVGKMHQTIFGAAANLFVGGCLLFWPGKDSDEDAGAPPLTSWGDFELAPLPPVASAAPSPGFGYRPAAPAGGFGRRGL